nr:3',5'-cyclic-nucleotide phosphodiesterase [Desulfuromonadales bacterium]
MKVDVLGSYGARLPGFSTASFMIDDRLLIDAGTVTWTLPLEQQLAIDDILLTHAHLDHMVDLAFLADNVFGLRKEPIRVWAPGAVLSSLHEHLFNNKVWPDFSNLPGNGGASLAFCPLDESGACDVAGFQLEWARTNHPVCCAGYLLRSGTSAVLFSGDTGTTEDLWNLGRRCRDLKAAFVEASFPNSRHEMATASGHLTPALLAGELKKLNRDELTILVYHMKPQFLDEILAELAELDREGLQALKGGESFRF